MAVGAGVGLIGMQTTSLFHRFATRGRSKEDNALLQALQTLRDNGEDLTDDIYEAISHVAYYESLYNSSPSQIHALISDSWRVQRRFLSFVLSST